MPRYEKLSKEEEAAIRSRVQPRCPGKIRTKGNRAVECGSHHTGYCGGFSSIGFVTCYRCGHEWGWVDSRGRSITKTEYDALVQKEKEDWKNDRTKRPSWSYGSHYVEEDAKMAKKKAKKSRTVSKGKSNKGGGLAAAREAIKNLSPKERSERSAYAYAAFLMHTTTMDNPEILKATQKKFKGSFAGTAPLGNIGSMRSTLQKGAEGHSWLKSVAHKGDSYFGHKPAKSAKATPKKAAKKAKKKTANKKSRQVSA